MVKAKNRLCGAAIVGFNTEAVVIQILRNIRQNMT